MLKEIALVGSALVSLNANNLYQRNNSHVVEEEGMRITYKYESNEVESADDIVLGNLYEFNIDSDTIDSYLFSGIDTFFNFVCIDLIGFDFGSYSFSLDEVYSYFDDNLYLPFGFYVSGNDFSFLFTFPQNSYNDYVYSVVSDYPLDYDNFSFHAIGYFTSFQVNVSDISFLSYTDYNVIESVERIYPDNVMGYVSEFIDENILAGIPNIDNVLFSVGGQDITLRGWLNTSICIVIALSIIFFLYLLLRYLFRLVSGLLSNRG